MIIDIHQILARTSPSRPRTIGQVPYCCLGQGTPEATLQLFL